MLVYTNHKVDISQKVVIPVLLQREDREGEEEEEAGLERSRWRRVREAGHSAGSLALTRWCSDLVAWAGQEEEEEEEFYNSQDEVNDFLLTDLTEREQERLNK